MFCPNCGKQIPDHSHFCSYCGSSPDPFSESDEAFWPDDNRRSRGRKRGRSGSSHSRKNRIIWIVLAALAVLIAAIILLVVACDSTPTSEASFNRNPAPSDFSADSGESQAVTQPQPAATTAATAPDSDVTLPSFLSVASGTGFSVKSTTADGSYGYKISYGIDSRGHFDVVQEYVDILVNDYGCRIENHDTSGGKDWDNETWYLIYPCDEATPRELGKDVGIKGNIWIHYMEIDGIESALTLAYISPLVHPDATRISPDPDPDPNPEKCWTCGGDGYCNTCGGSGQVRTWTGDGSVYQRCTDAFCSSGKCNRCGGDGYK